MSVPSVLAAGRRTAEARMTSRAIVYRPGGTTTDGDGYEIPAWDTIDADCPGRLAGGRGAGASRTVTIGGAEVTLAAREWHMPVSRAILRDGDLLDITAGENAGLVFRVVESAGQDQATARRVPVVEVPRPEEWP